MTTDGTRTVADLLEGERIAVFTTTAPDGTLMSRPMARQEVGFDGDLWFFAARDSRKVAHVTANPQVDVATAGSDSWVSLTGHAVVVDDLAKKRQLWNAGVGAWFPDGPDDAGTVLLRVDAASAEYWDDPGGEDRHRAQLRQGQGHRHALLGRGERDRRTLTRHGPS